MLNGPSTVYAESDGPTKPLLESLAVQQTARQHSSALVTSVPAVATVAGGWNLVRVAENEEDKERTLNTFVSPTDQDVRSLFIGTMFVVPTQYYQANIKTTITNETPYTFSHDDALYEMAVAAGPTRGILYASSVDTPGQMVRYDADGTPTGVVNTVPFTDDTTLSGLAVLDGNAIAFCSLSNVSPSKGLTRLALSVSEGVATFSGGTTVQTLTTPPEDYEYCYTQDTAYYYLDGNKYSITTTTDATRSMITSAPCGKLRQVTFLVMVHPPPPACCLRFRQARPFCQARFACATAPTPRRPSRS